MQPILQALLGEALRHVAGSPRRERAETKITIPAERRNDPQVQALLKLAGELAEYRRLPSGLEVRAAPQPGAEDRILEAIRDVVGGETFDQLYSDLLKRQADLDAQQAAAQIVSPAGMTNALREGLIHGFVPVESQGEKVRLLNKADAGALGVARGEA